MLCIAFVYTANKTIKIKAHVFAVAPVLRGRVFKIFIKRHFSKMPYSIGCARVQKNNLYSKRIPHLEININLKAI